MHNFLDLTPNFIMNTFIKNNNNDFFLICRVRLSKRRALNKELAMTNSTLVVKNRALNEGEVALQVSTGF